MRCGWTEIEIGAAVKQILKKEKNKELILQLAAEAKERGNSWPLKPKFVEKPPLYLKRGKCR